MVTGGQAKSWSGSLGAKTRLPANQNIHASMHLTNSSTTSTPPTSPHRFPFGFCDGPRPLFNSSHKFLKENASHYPLRRILPALSLHHLHHPPLCVRRLLRSLHPLAPKEYEHQKNNKKSAKNESS